MTRKKQSDPRPACLKLSNTRRAFSSMWRIASVYWRTGWRWAYLVLNASFVDGSSHAGAPSQ